MKSSDAFSAGTFGIGSVTDSVPLPVEFRPLSTPYKGSVDCGLVHFPSTVENVWTNCGLDYLETYFSVALLKWIFLADSACLIFR